MKKIILIAGLALSNTFISAQVNPVVTGDTMLCPEGTGTLTTGTYDSYQWYQRYFMSEDTFAITGATSQTLEMNYYDFAASYLIVEVTENGVTGMSEEIFVDGYAFAGPIVSMTGDFETGQNGEAVICQGDTLFLRFLQPYTENIVWYNYGEPIVGQGDTVLAVTYSGSYTVSGSPEVCPEYTATMGVPVEVTVENCGLGLEDNTAAFAAIYPNPASDKIIVTTSEEPDGAFAILDQSGRIVKTAEKNGFVTEISLDGLSAGAYFLETAFNSGKEVQRFVIK